MRKQIDGLVAVVELQFKQKLNETSIFLFCGRRADRIKALYWDGTGYMLVQKQEDGSMAVTKQPVKEEWMGDRTRDYADRYGYYFPGEREAKGLPEEETSGGWGK